MAIYNAKDMRERKQVIDLRGPMGNAYSLLGYARSLCKLLGIDAEPIVQEMVTSDYENLIKVFDKHFGKYVDLYR